MCLGEVIAGRAGVQQTDFVTGLCFDLVVKVPHIWNGSGGYVSVSLVQGCRICWLWLTKAVWADCMSFSQILTNGFKTLLHSSQPHLWANHLKNILRLIHWHQKLPHCFTWTPAENEMLTLMMVVYKLSSMCVYVWSHG